MIKSNLHTHTTLSDGRGTVKDNIEAAIAAGFVSLGISDHSYLEGDEGSIGPDEEKYVSAVREAAEEYKGKIDVFCGLELDALSECRRELYDYVIASVHILQFGERRYQIDCGHLICNEIKERYLGGSANRLAEEYFKAVLDHAKRTRPDIIGHFDLIELHGGVDVEDPEYVDMAVYYAEETAKYCPRFEVNTGAMGRGQRPWPYPIPPVLEKLKNIGAAVIPSSDCHNVECIKFGFDHVASLLKDVGFTSVDRLTKDGFVSDPL